MTYKYIYVRSDVFEKCNQKSFDKKRSFSDMKKLFTIKYWALFILLMAICITTLILYFCLQNKAYSFIPCLLVPIILSIEERYREKLFNPEARKNELLEKANGYKEYIENIEKVLSSHGITSSQYDVLRKECEAEIGKQSKTYDKMKARVLYQNLIKEFVYPMSTSDACNRIGRDGADCLTQAIHYLFKRLEYLVSEPAFPYFLPYLLNWVHFWSVWWNIE